MKEIPKEIRNILRQWLPKDNEKKYYEFIPKNGSTTKLTIYRNPSMSGFVIHCEDANATRIMHYFFSIISRGHGASMSLWSYSVAEERLTPDGTLLQKVWTKSTEVSPCIVNFEAYYTSLDNHIDPVYCRNIAFIEGIEYLSELVQSSKSLIPKKMSK